jgi:uncharacterized protein
VTSPVGFTEPVASTDPTSVTAALRSALAVAMSQRDRAALALYRTALSAIDNAVAVPLDEEQRAGAIESSAVGVGRAEATRRALAAEDEIDIVRREVQERLAAADSLASANPDAARQLRIDAGKLQAVLDGLAIDS